MAVFFGLMQGSLTRRWGWVELPKASEKVDDAGKSQTTELLVDDGKAL